MASVDFASRERFANWWPEIEPSVRRVAQRYLHATDSDDFVQEVGVACMIAVADRQFDDTVALCGWAVRRAKWRVFDWLRDARRVRRTDAVGSPVSVPESSPGVVEIMELVETLPARQRDLVRMSLAGDSVDDIAQRLGIAEASVRSSLRHARAYLARRLAGE